MVHAITNKKSLFTTFEACFGTESTVINKEIESKINDLFSKYSSIEEELSAYVLNSDNHIRKVFDNVGLIPFLSKMKFDNLFVLSNGQVGLTIYFELNEESKKIFIDEVVDDWGEKIGCFQDVAIYEKGKCLFSSTTHEDCYSFNEK